MNLDGFLTNELNLLNEKMVPMSYSYEDWEKKERSPKEYHEKNPSAKWKIVHCHKKGKIGDALPGATNLSYQEALKRHRGIQMRKGG